MYIQASSTISHQSSFANPGYSKHIKPLTKEAGIIEPDYRDFISAGARRRLSPVIKMALVCAMKCIEQTKPINLEAIIVGTGLGSNHHTAKFLDNILEADGGLISPTSFTLSTANSIAGQLSIHLGNHGYNNTHSQSTLSFEQALVDSQLCLLEDMDHVLVGAADESTHALFNLYKYLNLDGGIDTVGASFFVISKHATRPNQPRILDIQSHSLQDSLGLEHQITAFKEQHSGLGIDLVLYSSSTPGTLEILKRNYPNTRMQNFVDYAGIYLTNSGFALDYTCDLMSHQNESITPRTVLICNNLYASNVGLVLVTNQD